MTHPGAHAADSPDKIAAVLADTGEQLTFAELEERSVRLANTFRAAGLQAGDVVALLSENNLRVFEVYWAAMRSGLYITAINHNLAAEEVAYIVGDSGAAALVVSAGKKAVAESVLGAGVKPGLLLAFDGAVDGFDSYEDALAAASDKAPDDQPHGAPMLYSSGTTGRPKGVRPPLPPVQVTEIGDPLVGLIGKAFGVGSDTVYLTPAPIYHAAPLRWCGAIHAFGGTVVMLRKFDSRAALSAIETYRVTHAQFVPTMFVRMLQLPEEARAAADVSSLRVAVHAAAPCPVDVKQAMIDWWGPILVEYYAGTEGNGLTMTDSTTWLTKPGTVGKSMLGVLHVCDDDGNELDPGEVGNIYVEREIVPFEYHNDPEKTRAAQHPQHPTWTTLGDIGYVDSDGFLFLTDRKSFMIISGGVNIYPQETENVLALHPAIHDVAVVGLPDPEMGEKVTAFVQPRDGVEAGPELGQEIIEFVKSKIAGYKAPRVVHFVEELPRTETGKLVKGDLKKRYATG
ncbi:acyl-CoA synthetase (plasmid) [Pseudonocardia sp. EC080610-09]|uniref:acyl-CoA synthetase n=1 Tax=unclassified Pseudonocardia TaxID=2619320 RepID=UPI000705B032|nr:MULTISPECIES: acyl-CoA synthetase [unclassified Pseudonocardia]ALL79719.1 acyl-CoA synthetase [Pseudonocardia sp. EC080610-09]ALL85150.1 acyl-CoA synthetase [Pseudonocardia sp. EC080619-01]